MVVKPGDPRALTLCTLSLLPAIPPSCHGGPSHVAPSLRFCAACSRAPRTVSFTTILSLLITQSRVFYDSTRKQTKVAHCGRAWPAAHCKGHWKGVRLSSFSSNLHVWTFAKAFWGLQEMKWNQKQCLVIPSHRWDGIKVQHAPPSRVPRKHLPAPQSSALPCPLPPAGGLRRLISLLLMEQCAYLSIC